MCTCNKNVNQISSRDSLSAFSLELERVVAMKAATEVIWEYV